MNSLMVYLLNITTGLIFSSQPWRGFGKLYIALHLHRACPPDADIKSCHAHNECGAWRDAQTRRGSSGRNQHEPSKLMRDAERSEVPRL